VERGFPVLLIAPPGRAVEHLEDVLLRLRRRRAQTAVLASEPRFLRRATVPIPVPASVEETLSPHVYALPLQLLAYHLSLARGLDPDRPRGLRKVTKVR
jgi:glucosamine--fructose-6-phosphate aminotransferase (isomerizing)